MVLPLRFRDFPTHTSIKKGWYLYCTICIFNKRENTKKCNGPTTMLRVSLLKKLVFKHITQMQKQSVWQFHMNNYVAYFGVSRALWRNQESLNIVRSLTFNWLSKDTHKKSVFLVVWLYNCFLLMCILRYSVQILKMF